jgi:TolB protein
MEAQHLLLRSEMWKICNFLLFCTLLFSEELEVRLATQTRLKPVYLTRLHTEPSEFDWRYFEELRSCLEHDLTTNGFCSVLSIREDFENKLQWPHVKNTFQLEEWRKENVPYILAIQTLQGALVLTLFDIEKGSAKKFHEVPLSGRLSEDRRLIHRLSDTVTKELFGVEGIASLKILYSQKGQGEKWESEIWVCDADGAEGHALTRDGGYCVSPGFFPRRGTEELEYYYVSYKGGQSKIYRSFLSEPGNRPMISLRGNHVLPAIAQGGGLFAFIADVAGRPDLFLQSLDSKGRLLGKARQIYSQPRATQASPTFSPDGRQIAFVSDKDGPPRIYQLPIPSAKSTKRLKPELLTVKNRENTSPSWSPDGKKLAYSARTEGVRQIWLYDFETKAEIRLTSGGINKENPSWAPDSLHIVYNTEGEQECELYVLHINEPSPICITKGTGQKRFACWEPR